MTRTVSLSELLDPAAVSVDLQGADKGAVLAELCALLEKAGLAGDRAAALEAVNAREAQGSTGCGSGVAVPHARLAGLSRTAMALGISKRGIAFGGVDNEPVRIFFLLLGPQNDPEHYLKTLSQIAKLIKERDFRDALLACPDPAAVVELIRSTAL